MATIDVAYDVFVRPHVSVGLHFCLRDLVGGRLVVRSFCYLDSNSFTSLTVNAEFDFGVGSLAERGNYPVLAESLQGQPLALGGHLCRCSRLPMILILFLHIVSLALI